VYYKKRISARGKVKTKKYLDHIYDQFSLNHGAERRRPLISEMDDLGAEKVNCYSCSGKCCTYMANSVQIDPLQTLELLDFLIIEKRWNNETRKTLEQNIIDFRLDNEILLGRGKALRRYYTCPFFVGGGKGCSIDPKSKPYGCLGFNPSVENAEEGNGCHSNRSLLEAREDQFQSLEEKANQYLKRELNIYWEKKPIPVALLELASLLS
jgi:Fe-S-cluster containining protein